MKKHYSLFLLLVLALGCTEFEEIPDLCVVDLTGEYAYQPAYRTILPIEVGETLAPCTRAQPADVDGFYPLLSSEICPLEQNFLKVLELESDQCCAYGRKITFLESYALQHIGMIINGKKYVYTNAFLFEDDQFLQQYHPNWKDQFAYYCDGGSWGVLFDPVEETFSQLSIDSR